MRTKLGKSLATLALAALAGASQVQAGPPTSTAPTLPDTALAVTGDCCPTTAACCDPCPPCSPWQMKCGVFADFLYLGVKDADLAYARVVRGCGVDNIPAGGVGILDPDYQEGFRVGGTIAITPNSCVQATWLWYESNSNGNLHAPDSPIGDISVQSLLSPLPLSCGSGAFLAAASYDIDLNQVDLDYKHILCCNECAWLTGVVGVRWAQLDQETRVEYVGVGSLFVNSEIDLDAIGPRLGLDGEVYLCHGFLFYGRAAANFLLGQYKVDIRQTDTFAVLNAESSYRDDRLTTVLDLELGVGWTSCTGRCRVQAGYLISAWQNAVTTPSIFKDLRQGTYGSTDDLVFEGLTAGVEVRF